MFKSGRVKLSDILKETVIPILVENFYSNGDGRALREELLSYVSMKGEESGSASFSDFLELFYQDELTVNFDGLIILASNVDISGFEEMREGFEELACMECKTTLKDPILNARDSGGITKELYRLYAGYRVMELSMLVLAPIVNSLITKISEKGEEFIQQPFSEMALHYGLIGKDKMPAAEYLGNNLN